MKKFLKKALSIVVAILMVLSAAPVSAFAWDYSLTFARYNGSWAGWGGKYAAYVYKPNGVDFAKIVLKEVNSDGVITVKKGQNFSITLSMGTWTSAEASGATLPNTALNWHYGDGSDTKHAIGGIDGGRNTANQWYAYLNGNYNNDITASTSGNIPNQGVSDSLRARNNGQDGAVNEAWGAWNFTTQSFPQLNTPGVYTIRLAPTITMCKWQTTNWWSIYGWGRFDYDKSDLSRTIAVTVRVVSDGTSTGEQFPAGYDFNTDRWNFPNINETISVDYYKGIFKQKKGTEIHGLIENGSKHGHCYGMATSTAATLWNAPNVRSYISWNHLSRNNLKSVNKSTMNTTLGITAKDYIKYCQVYQFSTSTYSKRISSDYNGITNVYNAVKASLNNNDTTGIVIDLWKTRRKNTGELEYYDGHTIYAIGIDGKNILVNDSNEPNSKKTIEINGNEWTYSGGGHTWSSENNSQIDYIDSVMTPYFALTSHNSIPSIDNNLIDIPNFSTEAYTEDEELNGTTEYYSTTIEPVDTDKLLVYAESSNVSFEQKEMMYELIYTDGSTDTNNTVTLYWLNEGDVINVSNTSSESETVKLIGNNFEIIADLPESADAEIKVNEEEKNSYIDIEANKGKKLTVSFSAYNEETESDIDLTINGIASDETITATQTDDGIVVTGFDSMTITLETENGTSETEVKNADGEEINIFVDEENNVVTTDYGCKHKNTEKRNEKDATCTEDGYTGDTYCLDCEEIVSTGNVINALGHIDDDGDGYCDICDIKMSEDDPVVNCTCACHKSGIVNFFWKIANFFRKLFGMDQYRYCSCGRDHWKK